MKFNLLTRDQFREAVFQRDGQKCVVCKQTAVDAHHILERKLWDDGGYYLENGASVCQEHHLLAESTEISCQELRKLSNIKQFPLPAHLYENQEYDKWGNICLPNGNRLKGELFTDISVQKILQPVLHLFVEKVKYPRTYHLPYSPGATSDDKVMSNLSVFESIGNSSGIVITEKMDGENTSMYRNYIHARSIEDSNHVSRAWVKSLHGRIKHNIPDGWRLCGENVFAKHSLRYDDLNSYFLLFSIWNENNICLSWSETEEWASLLELEMVPVLYKGLYKDFNYLNLINSLNFNKQEGFVLRIAESFSYKDFKTHVAKYVRKGHIETSEHWSHEQIIKNSLKHENKK